MLPTAKNATNSIKATNMLIHFQNAQIATDMMALDGKNPQIKFLLPTAQVATKSIKAHKYVNTFSKCPNCNKYDGLRWKK
jgi:hypothetical protein